MCTYLEKCLKGLYSLYLSNVCMYVHDMFVQTLFIPVYVQNKRPVFAYVALPNSLTLAS